MRVVVALGGNALLRKAVLSRASPMTADVQRENVKVKEPPEPWRRWTAR